MKSKGVRGEESYVVNDFGIGIGRERGRGLMNKRKLETTSTKRDTGLWLLCF